jgi:hypothetical protein
MTGSMKAIQTFITSNMLGFGGELGAEWRREVFGEDIGQQG